MAPSEDLISKAAGLAAAAAALAAVLLSTPPAKPEIASQTGSVISALVVQAGAGQAAQKPQPIREQEPQIPAAKDQHQDVRQKAVEPKAEPKPADTAPAVIDSPKPKSEAAALPEPKPKKAPAASEAESQSVKEKPASRKPAPEAKPKAKPAQKAPNPTPKNNAAKRPAAKPEVQRAHANEVAQASHREPQVASVEPGADLGASRAPSKAAEPAGRPSDAQAQAMAQKVRAELSRSLSYPKAAQRRGIEGRVLVRFEIRAGRVVSSSIIKGSGFPILDEDAARLAAKMTGFKAGNDGDLLLEIPVEYRLE